MKQYKILFLSAFITLFASCDKWNDASEKTIDSDPVLTEEYYKSLRDFKAQNKQLSFGWFGGWTGKGPSRVGMLMSVPDSVDLVALWGNNWHRRNMTPERFQDLENVREKKGTKILVTSLLGWTGKELPDRAPEYWGTDRQEGLKLYAKELAEEIIDLGFDGFDIDYEPFVGGAQDVKECPLDEDMVVFVKELGKYFGPKSGTGRLLVCDGELDQIPQEVGEYFDYAIAQAYNSSSDSGLASRYNRIKKSFRLDQFIVTENFESLWKTGGVDYTTADGLQMPSILGMAQWENGQKGGCGTFHMEYEYGHTDKQYKYLREAIQIMNPAKH